MTKFIKKRSKKAGLPPGTLIHIGEKRGEEIRASIVSYDEGAFLEHSADNIMACLPFRGVQGVNWIGLEGIHQIDTLQTLGETYGLHPLVMEDILNTDQRPKREDYGDYIYIVLKTISSRPGEDVLATEQVSLVLGQNFVLSIQEGLDGDMFSQVRERLRNSKGRIRKLGADYLVYALLDTVVDSYFAVLENLAERIELLEDELVASPGRETLQKLHGLKREVIFLRKSVWPLREVISGLERRESPLIQESTVFYLRDVYDHTIQIIDTVETFRDMLSSMLDIYLSSISNRTNEVMRVLTVIATIFMPLTFIVGLYGMNFKYMPELEWHWGYPAVILLMVLISYGMLCFFRRKKWL